MLETIAALLLLVLGAVLMIVCIRATAESDGICHYEDCDGCPYSGMCDEQERKENERRETDGCDYDQHG